MRPNTVALLGGPELVSNACRFAKLKNEIQIPVLGRERRPTETLTGGKRLPLVRAKRMESDGVPIGGSKRRTD